MASPQTVIRRLNWVTAVAIVDAVALVFLIWAAITDREGVVDILGPAHGGGFVLLCVLIGIGCLEKLWGWWFLIITIVTLGPPGSLIGEVIIRKRVKEQQPA
jgi:hypothetical protein